MAGAVMEQIRDRAAGESPLLEAALRPGAVPAPRYAGRCPDRYLIGVEMIREGYLLHHGRSVLFAQDEEDLALLTGDYLYAAGLVEICATGDLRAVRTLARLIAECSARRGDAEPTGDDALWDEAVAALGR
ncbi:MAG TPA: hypothetical protein VE824_01415 [Gaiellales bacterium]|nr:hypothetical protein [Gaiellales bacterium]